MKPNVLLLNPPVYDFSAYDFWARPYGLLRLGGWLRNACNVVMFDFMDRSCRGNDSFGRGEYQSEQIARPAVFADIPRNYKRFGLPRECFRSFLRSQRFDFVMVNTGMTYWYGGVREVIADIRDEAPATRIVLGGVYATICHEHAAKLDADLVVKGGELSGLWKMLSVDPDLDAPPFWDGYALQDVGVLKISDGCPFNCTYCASKSFNGGFSMRPLSRGLNEVNFMKSLGIRHVAFYDDALLHDAGRLLLPFLDSVSSCGVTFHTPNALHARLINDETASALVGAGFRSFFLGFENSSDEWHGRTGGKTNSSELADAVRSLERAGAGPESVTAYVLFGHPVMDAPAVEDSLRYVNSLGIRAMLSEFSPLPGTPDGELCGRIVDLCEPLNHNKTVFTIRRFGDESQRLKDLCRTLNKSVKTKAR